TLATAVRETGREQQTSLAKISHEMAGLLDALARLQDDGKQLHGLQETLNQNLAALAGAGTFEEALHSLTAAVHLLTARAAAPAADREEWEHRRQMLHEQLQRQDQQVLRELQGVHSQLGAAAGSVQTELARRHELQEQLQAERSGLARSEDDLTAQRTKLAGA